MLAGLALLAASFLPLHAGSFPPNDPDYLFAAWETEDGLPSDVVTALAQTPEGYLWLGTPEGLARFDGFQFTFFSRAGHPGLPDNAITHLLTDRSGRLWVGTAKGLCFYEDRRFQAVQYGSGRLASLVESEGVVWIVFASGRVAAARGDVLLERAVLPASDVGWLQPERNADGRLWHFAESGTALMGETNWLPAAGWGQSPAWGTTTARERGLWLATAEALHWVHGTNLLRQIRRQPAGPGPVRLMEDSRGHLWTASGDGGLVRYQANGAQRIFQRGSGLTHNTVLAMLEDRDGLCWFGTDGGGVVRMKPRRFTRLTEAEGLPHPSVHVVTESVPGVRWVGTQGGLVRWENGRLRPAQTNPPAWSPGVPVTALRATRDGVLHVGLRGQGLLRVAPDGTASKIPLGPDGADTVRQLSADRSGGLWAAAEEGLFRIDGVTAAPVVLPSGARGARALADTGSGLHVALLPAGLAAWREGILTELKDDSGAAYGIVTALAAGSAGELWLSGPGCPLGELRDGVLRRIPAGHLPAAGQFTCLVDDGLGTLWLGSADGLFRLSKEALLTAPPKEGSVPSWTRFDTLDGLAGTHIRSLALGSTAGGRKALLIGTTKGLSMADPAAVLPAVRPCRPVIESLLAYEPTDEHGGNQEQDPRLGQWVWKAVNERATPLPLTPGTAVPAGVHRVEVRFTGVDLNAPERVRFRYRLAGLQDSWSEVAGKCAIPFHRLAPGAYTFEVKARNADGVWGDEVAAASFVIQASLWETTGFRVGIALASAFAVGGLVWMGNRTKVRRHDELMEQQEHLAREKARLASVLEATSDLVAFADPDFRIFYMNPAGCRAVEVATPSSDHSLPFDLVLAPQSVPRFHEEAAPAAILRGVWSGEMVLRVGSDRTLPVSQVMLCHTRADGMVDFFSFVMRDLSPLKEAEARHEKLEAQLRQAQKMEAVGLLAGGVAHDFNNILQVILGHSSIALEKSVPEGDRENSLIEVKKAARRAAQLTKQLLAFGRRQPLQKLHFDLNMLVQDALEMTRRLLGADIEIVFRPAEDPAVVFADRGQVEQVLMNLCVNARDAMPRGGKLTIEIRPLHHSAVDGDTNLIGPLPSGPCVRVSVSDTGTGISPENIPHIFEPFFSTKPKNKGSGLGLAVVYGIIQQHGGSLRIESQVDVGTTFHVYLPASPGAVAVQRLTREIPVKRGSGTILLAEDEEAVRLLATRILQKAGYTVLAARDGEEAVTLYRENTDSVDLLLMDVIMPRLSGPEAVKQIRELNPEMPAVYASGYGGDFLRADGRLDIDGDILQKPYQPTELLDRISHYLRNTRS